MGVTSGVTNAYVGGLGTIKYKATSYNGVSWGVTEPLFWVAVGK